MDTVEHAIAGSHRRGEQTRARYPDADGWVERDGVRVFYEVYGDGEPTILLLPTWTFVHSRIWRMQIPYFARHHRVVVFDPRGNGKSDRPRELGAFAESEFAQDALDVMDAIWVQRAMIVSVSRGAQRALLLAADHAERVAGAIFLGPFFPASPLGGLRWRILASPRLRTMFLRPPVTTRGWAKFNAVHVKNNYEHFVDWFAARCTTQSHSTKAFEDHVDWALETDAHTLILTMLAKAAAPVTRRDQLELAGRVHCPVLVIHGTDDRVTSLADAAALANATGGRLIQVDRGDHAIEVRRPVEVNLVIREFLDASFRR